MVIKISTHKFKALSQISTDIGQVSFATLVISPFLSDFENNRLGVILIGTILSFVFWYFSVILAEKGKL